MGSVSPVTVISWWFDITYNNCGFCWPPIGIYEMTDIYCYVGENSWKCRDVDTWSVMYIWNLVDKQYESHVNVRFPCILLDIIHEYILLWIYIFQSKSIFDILCKAHTSYHLVVRDYFFFFIS